MYIQGKSKAAVNRELKNGKTLIAYDFNAFTGDKQFPVSSDGGIPDGTIIKVFEKYIYGNPVAKAYGTWKNGKVS